MGSVRQKRKRRSGQPVVRPHNHSKKLVNPLGNSTISKNWNKDETMTQNYRRLGLVARLKAPKGGTEKFATSIGRDKAKNKKNGKTATDQDSLRIPTMEQAVVGEAIVKRDNDGNIVSMTTCSVIGGKRVKRRSRWSGNDGDDKNPLGDALNDLESDEDGGDSEDSVDYSEEWGGIDQNDNNNTTDVVKELEAQAAMAQPSKPRTQSSREQEWIASLVSKHGDDTRAMVRDKRLNPMQQTETDIAKRLKKWKANGGRG